MTNEECRVALAMHPDILRYLDTFVDLDEYLRRNLLVARAIGARAGVETIRNRLGRRAPKWLREQLDAIETRVEPLPTDLARWRDLVGPSPVTGRLAAQAARDAEHPATGD